MFDLLLDIPYEIVSETIELDYGVTVIDRTYKLPFSIFISPNKYASFIRKYDRKVFEQDGMKIHVSAGGWKDANCKTYGITFYIESGENY